MVTSELPGRPKVLKFSFEIGLHRDSRGNKYYYRVIKFTVPFFLLAVLSTLRGGKTEYIGSGLMQTR